MIKYIALQEIKIQLKNPVFWIWILLMTADIFLIQMGAYFFPSIRWGDRSAEYAELVRVFFDYTAYEFYTFSIFIAGFILHRDRKNNFFDILNSKNIKPGRYIWGRYLGVVFLYLTVLAAMSTLGFLLYGSGDLSFSPQG